MGGVQYVIMLIVKQQRKFSFGKFCLSIQVGIQWGGTVDQWEEFLTGRSLQLTSLTERK